MTLTLPQGLFRRGNTYSVRYTVPSELQPVAGRREIVKSLGTSDLKEALAKRREALDDIRDTLLGTKLRAPKEEPKVPTVAETAHRWLVQSDGIKPSTKQKYRMILGSFERFTGDCEVTKINRKLALDYIDHIKTTPSERTGERLSARAVGSYQACLASYWRVLDHWGLVDPDMRNPFASLLRRMAGQRKKVDPREKKLRPVTREEAEALLGYITGNPRLRYQREMYVTVRLLWATACRLNEICGRRLEDIDDRGDHIRITIPEAKTEAGKRVVMIVGEDDCQLLRDAMRQALTDKPETPAHMGMLFPRLRLGGYDKRPSHYLGKALEASRKALAAEYCPTEWDMHSFRRAGVSALVNAGVSREARNLAVGHSNKDDLGVSVYAKRGDLARIVEAAFRALHDSQGGGLHRTSSALKNRST
jgi:integrase